MKPSSDQEQPRRPGLLSYLRTNFLAGLVVVAPISITIYIIWGAIGLIDSWVLPLVPDRYNPQTYLGVNVHGIGLVIFVVFTLTVGYLTRGFVGNWIVSKGEQIVARLPIVRTVYNALKQILETAFADREKLFQQACLVEYPRPGLWAIAFISSTAKGEISHKIPNDDKIVAIFIPTTPNPTSGFILFLPVSSLIMLDMSLESAGKVVISAGLVYPPYENQQETVLASNGPA
ncbi:MAG: DUF502 domain-containing protein [Rhodobacteraceae bacterium]|nr:DUF502 domain-containing protein [Paracoccaceae bacterium]